MSIRAEGRNAHADQHADGRAYKENHLLNRDVAEEKSRGLNGHLAVNI